MVWFEILDLIFVSVIYARPFKFCIGCALISMKFLSLRTIFCDLIFFQGHRGLYLSEFLSFKFRLCTIVTYIGQVYAHSAFGSFGPSYGDD